MTLENRMRKLALELVEVAKAINHEKPSNHARMQLFKAESMAFEVCLYERDEKRAKVYGDVPHADNVDPQA